MTWLRRSGLPPSLRLGPGILIPEWGIARQNMLQISRIAPDRDSKARDSEVRDSEVRDSEVRDSENRDSENRDSENGQIHGPPSRPPLIQTPLRLPLILSHGRH